jgi:hypothetical protein
VRVRRALLIGGGILVVLAIASQLAVPPLAERQIENRLTDGGGSASAHVSAFPAARLLFDDGDDITVSGSDLSLEIGQETDVMGRLDGFDSVDVRLSDSLAGPFRLRECDLARPDSGADYSFNCRGSTTPGDLAGFGADQLGLIGGPLLDLFTGQALGHRPIPFDLRMGFQSDDGRIVVVSGGGTVAGYPAGPLAELITATIVVRL